MKLFDWIAKKQFPQVEPELKKTCAYSLGISAGYANAEAWENPYGISDRLSDIGDWHIGWCYGKQQARANK